MLILLLALAAAALAAPPLLRVVGRPAFLILAAVLAAGFFWVLSLFVRGTFADGGALTESISWLDELPKTGSGKILKRELRAPFWAGRTSNV